MLLKVLGLVAGGQLMKIGQVMQRTSLPNIVIIMRVPAHIVRISCRDPLHDADAFSAQYNWLFDRRHGVLKDFQNSDSW